MNSVINALKMVITVAIGFLVTPVLIKSIGVDGFGLLVAIGASGFLISVLTETLAQSLNRELAFSLGSGNQDVRKNAFSTIFYMQLSFGLLCTISLPWFVPFLSSKLTVPPQHLAETDYCLYVIVLQIGLSIISSPFQGLIVAHQHFGFMAIITVTQTVARLATATCLLFLESNQILVFVSATFITNLLCAGAATFYCLNCFTEAKPARAHISRQCLLSVFKYGSASAIGKLSRQLRHNGLTLFLNIFCGNSTAAANGIMLRLVGFVSQGLGTAYSAIQPAMTKNVGANQRGSSERMAIITSGLGISIATALSLPFILEVEWFLSSWIGEYPELAPPFIRLALMTLIIIQFSLGHNMALHANGTVGILTIVNVGCILLSFTIGIGIVYFFDASPVVIQWFDLLGNSIVVLGFQPIWACRTMDFSLQTWFRKSLLPGLALLSCLLIAGVLLQGIVASTGSRFVLVGVIGSLTCTLFLSFVVFNEKERHIITELFMAKITTIAKV